jgi:hypothetical protein
MEKYFETMKISAQQSNPIKGENGDISQYLQFITVEDLLALYDVGQIIIKRWTIEDRDGFQRIDNRKHIKNIAAYLTSKCLLMPQNLIMNNISDGNLIYTEEGDLVILNVTKFSLSDGQHRLLSFKMAIEDINALLIKFDKKMYKQRIINNDIDFKYLKEYKVLNKNEKLNVEATKEKLIELRSYLLNYKLSCSIFDKLTDTQESKMFFNINTKGLKVPKGMAQNVEYTTKINEEEFDHPLVWIKDLQFDAMQNTKNIFFNKIKSSNIKGSKGILTETGFTNALSDTNLVSNYRDCFGNEATQRGFELIFIKYWVTLSKMPSMADCFTEDGYTLLKTTGFVAVNTILSKLLERYKNNNGVLTEKLFAKCFKALECEFLNNSKWIGEDNFAKTHQGKVGQIKLSTDMWTTLIESKVLPSSIKKTRMTKKQQQKTA